MEEEVTPLKITGGPTCTRGWTRTPINFVKIL